jgi:hypothetical protein
MPELWPDGRKAKRTQGKVDREKKEKEWSGEEKASEGHLKNSLNRLNVFS